ncbi:hypothetical protein AV530_004834 [Patagioenas fasciata monilis]|uniref:Uncharacterized protein n=1 Tax=Patagioenas fasciata monilis TaxID=372326 RepID=A0A1V4KE64_PATFA|nr:hypothetical protein AV530_004834 [Patagioenas fasciata monilis]
MQSCKRTFSRRGAKEPFFSKVSKLHLHLPDDKAAAPNMCFQCCKNHGTRTGMFILHELVGIRASGISISL